MPYTCQVCFKKYTNKCWYDKHCLWCTDTPHDTKIRLEEMGDIPSVGIMYKMILDLSTKVKVLEKKCSEIKQLEKKETETLLDTIIENNEPAYTNFKDWYEVFTFSEDFIEDLRSKNIKLAITEYILEKIGKTEDQCPLIINNETKILYFYESEKYGWKILKRENFEPFIETIIFKIQHTFKLLYNNDIDDLDKYLELVQKVMTTKTKTIINSVYKELTTSCC